MFDAILFNKTTFLTSAPSVRESPADEGKEVAFAGRSNAGKSSVINALTGNNKLARTSKTPGRTQLLNFFFLTENRRLVDLPGYGFAKVPVAVKSNWNRNLAGYLQERKSLVGVIILMDIRHPLQKYDLQIICWASKSKMPIHLLLTKSDKLRRGAINNTLLRVEKELKKENLFSNLSLQAFSSVKKSGLSELKQKLKIWLN
ncbi:MAG: YihA family ribosome biogenesis GTP-binding protein [Porticoccus sp.]|jgi:GTP-binding protein|nr:YihA family ribosome biogenesis GTP-binding protein [Porticoccus sp.]|tara:strand:+ start:562 stop:1167 length:606 start_codon:yes stop_codon:yes gene_type:complete